MRDNSDEATKVLMDMGWNGGNYEMNIMINNSLQFGLSDQFTGDTLKDFIGRYIRGPHRLHGQRRRGAGSWQDPDTVI